MVTDTYLLAEAAFIARDWHGGLGCPLYALQCGQWDELTRDDIADAEAVFRDLERGNPDDLDLMDARTALELWLFRH